MTIFKLKPGKLEVLKSWANELMTTLHDEAVGTLKEENCSHEIFEFFEMNGEYYVAAHMEGDNILPANTSREINQKHRAVLKECVETKIPTQILYDLKANIDKK